MTSKLKTLGLAFAACIALTAMTSAVASAGAAEFHSDGTPTALKGNGANVIELDGGKITCKEMSYTGELVKSASPTLELMPATSSCTGFGSGTAAIDWNGCYLVHKISFDVGPPARFTSNVELFCPTTTGVKDEVVLTLVEAGVTKCTVHIPAQIIESGGLYTNGEAEGSSDITVDYSITSLQYSQVAGEGAGKCANASGTKNGKLTGEVTVSGQNSEKKPTSIWVE